MRLLFPILLLTACQGYDMAECEAFADRSRDCYSGFDDDDIRDWCREHESHRTHESSGEEHYACVEERYECPAGTGRNRERPMLGVWYFDECG